VNTNILCSFKTPGTIHPVIWHHTLNEQSSTTPAPLPQKYDSVLKSPPTSIFPYLTKHFITVGINDKTYKKMLIPQ
jgi:hypothetical protein